MKKIVLITGASSGMGYETAKLLGQQGHTVYAAARRLNEMEPLKEFGVIPVELDITNDSNNATVVEQIISEQGRVDVLINNAGYGLYGPVEEITMEDARYQFDVNIFGLAHITKEVLPHMRKQQSGRIINLSSMGGKVYTPLGAWYHATKHALEGWSDCLRLEVKQFGIDVVLIEPGLIKTNFVNVVADKMKKYIDGSAYKTMIDPYVKMMESPQMANMGTDVTVLAKEISKAVNVKRPKIRYMKGQMAALTLFIRKAFGDRFYDSFITKAFG